MKTARFLAVLFLLVDAGCTQERLQPPKKETKAAVDNLITVDADFCTQKPEEAVFPVKIMLILDSSGSLQFLDEGGLRVSAIRQLLSRFDGDPSVSFNIIQFNSFVYQFPPDGTFANHVDITDGQLQVAEVLTDYQAALSKAYNTLLTDMTRSGSEVLNTKYVVIFFSDGSPSPVCCPCEDETTSYTPPFFHPACDSEGNPDPPAPTVTVGTVTYQQRFCETVLEIPLCNLDLPRNGRLATAYGGIDGGLNVNGSYNRAYQIDQLLRDIVDLANTFEAGSFQFHTVFFNNPNLPQAIRDLLALNYEASRDRMTSMAAIGGGNFIEAKSPEELNFLQFNFTALKRAFGLRRVFVTNLNSVPGRAGPLVDSDGDGLSDEEEIRSGITDFLKQDTDGDGYGDLLEVRMADRGLDAKDPHIPFEPCPLGDRVDRDHDLLNRCEERFLGTNPEKPDSDFDTIPDGLELRFGLDPLLADADLDYDFDGVPNGQEVNNGTDPRLDDPVARDRASIRYRLTDSGETLDRRTCFGVTARNIQLQFTQGRDNTAEPGWNDIYLWELESPESNGALDVRMREACFRARFLPPDYKDPVTGTYRRLKDFELKSVYDADVLDKCWGPQLGTGVVAP